MSEHEPRRSVRATKGQHTKAFDQLENGPEPKRRQTKKGGKKVEKDEKQDEEEVIRCICGATTQDDDANEAWIACDQCGAWQHNVCMGLSIFTEDLPKEYFCEECRPADHKATLDAIKKGEKPWEDRQRKRHEEEDKKRKKGGRKSRGKRTSDTKERASPSASITKVKPSPTPDTKKEGSVTESEPVTTKGKRKSRDHSQGPQSKLRKVADAQPSPSIPKYTPPNDLPDSIQKLEGPRRQAAQGLQKSLDAAIDLAEKKKLYAIPQGSSKKSVTERLAIEIERAFLDTHPNTSHNASQLRTLMFSLKNNVELAAQVLNKTLPPTSFVVMTGDQLATKELQRETAEMKARAEKQSILITEDGPRVRRTHKGEELVEPDHFAVDTDDAPSSLRRQGPRDASETGTTNKESTASSLDRVASPANSGSRPHSSTGPLRIETQSHQHSPQKSNFDIGKVFSSVKSPASSYQRRPSAQVQSTGPGDDPEVDRLLQEDGNESPPYSPSENIDPDVVWRGPLVMTNVGDVDVRAKYAGGADLSKVRNIAWKDLIPPVLMVAGRITEEKAIPYLCGLRYNNQVDLVITSLTPSHPTDPNARQQFLRIIEYFQSKKRYGVVNEKKLGNVRDTYLVPVPEGDSPIPEPVQNIDGHLVPSHRSEPMLLMIFVYRDEKHFQIPIDQQQREMPGSAVAAAISQQQQEQRTKEQQRLHQQQKPFPPGPTWSPATPQGSFGSQVLAQPHYSQTPVPPPKIPSHPTPLMQAAPRQAPSTISAPVTQDPMVPVLRAAQAEGESKAKEVLGDLFDSPIVSFLLPHAARMKEGEWTAVRRALERDPKARSDLQLLSKLLTEDGNNVRKPGTHGSQANAAPGLVQTTLAAATNETAVPAVQPKT
ncbi:hypothetical protein F4804DRAFT_279478 [Jackrogersella minutella]|nr:hypothetical protein F4804DRAFT_279478 [Jackrogersella minutella]